VLSFAVGFYIDHTKSKRPFFASGAVLSLLWMARMHIWSFWHIAVINIIDKLTGDFHWLFYDTAFMRRGKGSQAFSFFVYREVIISISALIFWSLVVGLFTTVASGWTGLFVLASVGVLLTVLIKEKY
jgi:hypothetical protein